MSVSLKILKKILDDPVARDRAKATLLPEHFSEQEERFLFKLIFVLDDVVHAPITLDSVYEYLDRKQINERARQLLAGLLAEIAAYGGVTRSDFEVAITTIALDARKLSYVTHLQRAALAVSNGKLDEADGILTDVRAQAHRLAVDDRSTVSLRNMGELKPDDDSLRSPTGFSKIDEITGGGRPTEFWLWAAYLAEFKSTALLNIAHHNFTRGKKILIISLEMGPEEIQRRLLCIHGVHLNEVLPYSEVEFGRFTGDNLSVYHRVVDDFDSNPLYGTLLLHTPTLGATIDDIGRTLEIYKSQKGIEIVVLDYVQLIAPARKRAIKRDELNEILERTKAYALDLGVWIISGYQTSTEGRKKAEEKGYYDKWAMSETIGAGRIANVICWSLQTQDMLESKEIKIGLAKSRNTGIAGTRHFLACDPETGLMDKQPKRMDIDIYNDEDFDVTEVVDGTG